MSIRRILFALLMAALLAGAFVIGRRTAPPGTARNRTAHTSRDGAVPPVAGQANRATTAARPPTARPENPDAARSGALPLLARLAALNVSARNPQSVRQLLIHLEALREMGPAAVPAIREFLAAGQDLDYESPLARTGFRDGRVPADFVVPPSLRLGLLEVVKNIGGAEATELLARELKTTGRGVEAAYIAAALQQVAPGQFNEAAMTAARDLLSMPLGATAQGPLDRADREYLYGMLAAAGDRSQLGPAQAQLVLPTGGIDRGALRFLQQTLGEEAVAIAAQIWDDPRVAANQRQPLAALALTYVGVSGRAEQLWERAINDPQMPPDARKDLIEDLNQQGFANPRELTATDLPLIQRRLALIEQHAPKAKDAINAAAFAEAKKDLLEMRERVLGVTSPKK